MTEALAFLWPSFLVAMCLVGIHAYFGIQVLARNVIFVDLALAQIAALGATVAFMLGHPAQSLATYGYSLGFTLLAAVLLAFTRAWAVRVPQEALIGIIYVVSAAAGLLLLSRSAEGNEELRRTLIGDVLLVSPREVMGTFGMFLGIGAMHLIFRKQFLKLSFEPERAEAEGMAMRWWDFLFYALFGVVVTSFLQIGGVLLVFSYLIVPAVCANFLTARLGLLLLIGWLVATLTSVLGLFVAYKSDLPTGASIVCTLGAAMILTVIIARLRKDGGAAVKDK